MEDRIKNLTVRGLANLSEQLITCACKEDPLTSHYYTAKLEYTGVYIFLILALKH